MSDSATDSLSVPDSTGMGSAEPDVAHGSTTEAQPSVPQITFQGNTYDLASVIGVTIGVVTLFLCLTCNIGFYCLPIIPILLGIIGLISAKEAVEPERTRLLSWFSLGSGAAIALLILIVMMAYIGLIIFAIATEGNSF
jgi:hypothetical protein